MHAVHDVRQGHAGVRQQLHQFVGRIVFYPMGSRFSGYGMADFGEVLRGYVQQIAVEGHLKQDRWEKDGQKFSKVALVADNIQLLGGKNDGGSSAPSGAPKFQPNIGASNDGTGSYQSESFGETGSDFPEDIPF